MIVLKQISMYHLYYARHMVVPIHLESESAVSNILSVMDLFSFSPIIKLP